MPCWTKAGVDLWVGLLDWKHMSEVLQDGSSSEVGVLNSEFLKSVADAASNADDQDLVRVKLRLGTLLEREDIGEAFSVLFDAHHHLVEDG